MYALQQARSIDEKNSSVSVASAQQKRQTLFKGAKITNPQHIRVMYAAAGDSRKSSLCAFCAGCVFHRQRIA